MKRITSPPEMAICFGGVIIAVATNAVIQKTGGLWTSHALLVIGLSIGVFVASYVLPRSWSSSPSLAMIMIGFLICGEAYNFFATAERTIIVREETQAALRGARDAHRTAVAAVSALEGATPTSQRLAMAREALTAVRDGTDGPRAAAAAIDLAQAKAELNRLPLKAWSRREAAKRVVNAKSAALDRAREADLAAHGAALAKAEAEVAAALKDAETMHAQRIADAKAVVAATPLPPSATPLADRTSIPAWVLDLVQAALLSLGANGLAAALVAYGAHAKMISETSFSELKAETIAEIDASMFSGELPEPTPPKGGKRKSRDRQRLPATFAGNVVPMSAGNRSAHPVLSALENVGGSVSSNRELARLMGCTDGEASKRWQDIAHMLDVRRHGKQLRIALKA